MKLQWWKMTLPGLLLATFLLYAGCSNPAAGSSSTTSTTNAQQAADYVKKAITAMQGQDYETALSDFSKATTLDPTNGEAVMGYASLNIASIVTNSTLSTAMTKNIGLANYPTTIAAVLNPDTWVGQATGANNNTISVPLIQITGEKDYDNDGGIINFEDWAISMASFIANNNTSLDFIPQTLNGVLGSQAAAAIQTIKNDVTDSMQFTITWNMFYATQPPSSKWPYDSSGNPEQLVIGKAELLSVAALIEEVETIMHLAEVYSLALPLSTYWADFGPVAPGGTAASPSTNPSTPPFSTFLQPSSDAATQLADAKASLSASLADRITAADDFISDRQGFSISSDPTTTVFTGNFTFSQFSTDMQIVSTAAQEAQSSLANNSEAIFPTSIPANFDPATQWPTAVTPGSSFGINYGVAFSTPLNLISSSGLLQLASSGEPQFYTLSTGAAASFSPIASTSSLNPVSGTPTDFTNDPGVVFLKVTDDTFGGTVDPASFPVDNQANISGEYLESLSYGGTTYYASNGNSNWASLVQLGGAMVERSTNGVVKLSTIQSNGGLDAYFQANEPSGNTSPPINNYQTFTSSSNATALQNAVAALSGGPSIDAQGTVVLDDVSSTPALYIAVPEFYAWVSLASAGTTGNDPTGSSVTAEGSLYWYFLGHH